MQTDGAAQPAQAGVVLGADFSDPNRIEAEVEAGRACMLVSSDVWFPGWKAEVDGKAAEVFRVNYCQRGIWLEAGRHRVKMVFAPEAQARGLRISLLSAALLLVLWGVCALMRLGAGRGKDI